MATVVLATPDNPNAEDRPGKNDLGIFGAAPDVIPEGNVDEDFHREACEAQEYKEDAPFELQSVPGLKIHKMTLSRITLLKQIKNPLVDGLSLNETGNYFEHIQSLLYIQSLSLREATRVAYGEGLKLTATDPAAMDEEREKLVAKMVFIGGMKVASGITARGSMLIVNEILSLLRGEHDTQVTAAMPPGSGAGNKPQPPDPNAGNV